MDLSARVEALEEEVGILKGEIKLILQELRVAILARENPFADFGHEVSAPPPVMFVPPPPPPAIEPSNGVAKLAELPRIEVEPPAPVPFARPENGHASASNGAIRIEHIVAAEPAAPEPAQQGSSAMHRSVDLAALMAWSQETSSRFSRQDLRLVLSIARYGKLIDAELQETLLDLDETIEPHAERRATMPDFLLAVRQLESLLGTTLSDPALLRTAA